MATTLVRIQLLSKTSTDFATANPVLLDGEIGVANAGSAIPVMKIGDGVRPWTALPDIVAAGAGADYVAGPVNTLPAGSPATVVIDNTVSPPTISFGIPEGGQGDPGPSGPANSLAIGTVVTVPPGQPANAQITGTPPNQTLNLWIPSGLPGSMALADPTGLIGLTAVNGVSLLGTRSDARHAIDQSILPIWSAMHTFTALGAGSAAILLKSAVPGICFEETDATATNKVFRVRTQGHNFVMEMLDDAFGSATPFFAVLRSGLVASTMMLTATTTTLAGTTINLNATSIASTATGFTITNTNGPVIVLNDSDAAVNEKRWRIRNTGGSFQLFTEDDAATAVGLAMLVTRSGTTVTAIAFASTALTWNGNALIASTSNVTWTGQHLFAGVAPNGVGTTGVSLGTRASLPVIEIINAAGAVDARRWEWIDQGGLLMLQTINDAGSIGRAIFTLNRTGVAVTALTFGNSTDNPGYNFVGVGQMTVAGMLVPGSIRVGSTGGVTGSLITAAGSSTGNAFEWGHANNAGYRNTLGHFSGSGAAFVAFHAEQGTTSNTFRTRGVLGSVIMSNAAGAVQFARITNANADNQTQTQDLVWQSGGGFTFTSNVVIGSTGATQSLSMVGPVGSNRDIYFSTGATSRWVLRANAAAESGSSAGTNFEIISIGDGGTPITVVFQITRATGQITIPGLLVANGGVVMPATNLTGTQPIMRFNETDAPTDEKLFDITASGGDLFFRTRTDGDGAGATFLTVARTGTVVDSVALAAAQILHTGVSVFNSGTATGPNTVINGGTAAGPYMTFQRSGAAFGDIGNGGAMGGTFTVDALALVARAGFAIQFAAGGSTAPHFSIAATGQASFSMTPTAPTQAVGTNNTTLATTAFVQAALPSSAPRTWQVVTPASGVPVTNTTGRDLNISVVAAMPSGGIVNGYISGTQIGTLGVSGSVSAQASFFMVCPPGGTWQVNWSGISSITVYALM
jgi:hypothetical protein